MDMDKFAKTLNIQQDLKAAEIEEIIYYNFTHTDKRWSQLPSSPYTVSLAEGLLSKMMSRIHLYKSPVIWDGKFQVKYTGDEIRPSKAESDQYSDFSDTPIPLFKHIRMFFGGRMDQCTVTVTSSNEKVFLVHIKEV